MPTKVDGQPPPAENFGLQVSPHCYVNIWYFTLVMHVLCCAFLSFTTFVYFFLARPEMSYYAVMLGPSAVGGLKPVGYAFGCLVAAHVYDLFSMTWYSLQYSRLAYNRDVNDKHGQETEGIEINEKDSCFVRAWKLAQRFYWKLYRRRGVFGVESKYFEVNFAFCEITEVASQTFQAYSSSLLIASPTINTLYVTMIIFNCWSNPIVMRFCRKADEMTCRSRLVHAISRRLSSQNQIDEGYLEAKAMTLKRICCLCTELLLDAGAAMLVPMLIFLPCSRVFGMQAAAFPVEFLYSDV